MSYFISRSIAGHWGLEENRRPEGKSLDFRIQKLASAHCETTLEGVANGVLRMSVVGNPLVGSEPRSGLHQSLSNLLRLVSASVELSSH